VERSGASLVPALLRLIPRDAERRQIAEVLLQDDVRLVSVVGAPGAGKTRLAQMAAGELGPAFVDGVVFVDLTPIRDPALVPSAIGAALGIREASGREVTEGLKLVLRHQNVLLLLDNFEHLLPAAPFVADLLVACPRVKVLITSRQALRLAAEQRFTVWPLPVPTELDETDPRALERVASAALFCMRARAVRHDWTLDEANMHAVAELCRRLDGLPLGIELAAAWAAVLSPRALLARIEVCLNAEVARADQPDRHKSLPAAIGWSYDLLDAEERALFDRLAVFSGGWDDKAAAAVAGGTTGTVLPLLAALADKHLIVSAEQRADGEPRFGLLDTLHAFARARLEASDEVGEARRRHAEHYLALAERAEHALVGPNQRAWLDRLEQELENLRAALRWTVETGEAELALRLASALWFFWDMRGHLREGQQWLSTALAMRAGAAGASRAAALNAAGWLALVQHGTYAQGISLLEEGQSTAEATGDVPRLVRARAFLGLALALGTQEYERSEELLEAAVAEGRVLEDAWAVALALYGLGHVAVVQGRADRAQERWQSCAAVAQGVGNLYGQSYLQFRWGVLAFVDLDLTRAAACLRSSLQLASQLDSTREMAVALAALALVAWRGGQVGRAARLAGVTQAFLDRAGCYLPAFLQDQYERAVADVRERLRPSAFARSWRAGLGLSPPHAVAEALDTGNLPRYLPLTAREWDVARLVARGLTNREIADQLVVTERTIGSHLERIFAKLHFQSRAQLAVWAAAREESEPPVAGNAAACPTRPPVPGRVRRPRRRLRVVGA